MKRRGGCQSSLLAVALVCCQRHYPPTSTHAHLPTCPPATSHTSHGVTHFFLSSEHLGSATHRLQSTAVCVGERVCPSANSALSFKQICPDCPRTKLTSLPTASQTHFAGQTGKVFSSLYSTSQFTQQI